jgi:acyl carrier protein
MDRHEIVTRVNEVLEGEFELEAERITPEAHLFKDLGLDSLDAVDLIAALEAAFGHRVQEEEARKVRTVGDVYTLIENTAQRVASGD